eukprot:86027-Amphidinium_carterae.1
MDSRRSFNQCPQSELLNTRTNCLNWDVPVYSSIFMGRAQTLNDTLVSYTNRIVCDLEPKSAPCDAVFKSYSTYTICIPLMGSYGQAPPIHEPTHKFNRAGRP